MSGPPNVGTVKVVLFVFSVPTITFFVDRLFAYLLGHPFWPWNDKEDDDYKRQRRGE